MTRITTERQRISVVAGALLAVLASTLMLGSAASAKPPAKVDVCHLDDGGNYIMITVSERALKAFVAKGGGQPGDGVPGMPGFDFDEDCQPQQRTVVAPAGCYLLSDFSGAFPGYISTDGSLVGDGSGLPLYRDPACATDIGSLWGGTFVITWATDATTAQAQCEAARGPVGSVVDRTNFTPNLWVCVLAS